MAAVDPANPQSWNRYAYVLNNPASLLDPLGLTCYVANGSTSPMAEADCIDTGNTWAEMVDGGLQVEAAGGSVPYFIAALQADGSSQWKMEGSDPVASGGGGGGGGNSGSGGHGVATAPAPAGNRGAKPCPCFDTGAFASTLDSNALPKSRRKCAKYVRLAMEAGGVDTTGHPVDAGDYGPFLLRKGFSPVSMADYTPQMGDVVVFDKNHAHPSGHIAGYDGQGWVSDFRQHYMNPYKQPRTAGADTVYRSGCHCG